MIISYTDIDPTTLDNLIESFVLREGTDYGEQEVSLAVKVQAIRRQLKAGEVLIVYSELDETVNLMSKQHFMQQQAADGSM
ncbi:YheU family protein [Alishewanella sp. 16-MA]|uniref:YheU family protein n=1 Tax=Alishewanella maricola TaxID=2795740 RepID=A0ABS8C4I1_9ALTE|nr:YheU family protein [Alishewanella maricola]MCB5227238.1 YheU family protein [Alishewanella maricola]